MRKIEVMITPFTLDEVKNASAKANLQGMTVTEVGCFLTGCTKSNKEFSRKGPPGRQSSGITFTNYSIILVKILRSLSSHRLA